MGELQHGTYDDECEGLTLEEVNVYYDFGDDGETEADEEFNKGQEDSDDNCEESEADMELDEPGSEDVIEPLEHGFGMEVCFLYEIIVIS